MEPLSKQSKAVLDQLLLNKQVLKIKFSYSSGPWWQHINKTKTKAELFLNISLIPWVLLSIEQKEKLRLAAKNFYHEKKDAITLYNQETRNANLNRENVLDRLKDLLEVALKENKIRIETEMPYSASEKRIEEKKKRGMIKKWRVQKDFLSE